jgi:hypothetical protein
VDAGWEPARRVTRCKAITSSFYGAGAVTAYRPSLISAMALASSSPIRSRISASEIETPAASRSLWTLLATSASL